MTDEQQRRVAAIGHTAERGGAVSPHDVCWLLNTLDTETRRADEAERRAMSIGGGALEMYDHAEAFKRDRDAAIKRAEEAERAVRSESDERLRCRDGWALAAQERDRLRAEVLQLRASKCTVEESNAVAARYIAERDAAIDEVEALAAARNAIAADRGEWIERATEHKREAERLRAAGDAMRDAARETRYSGPGCTGPMDVACEAWRAPIEGMCAACAIKATAEAWDLARKGGAG